MEEECPTHPVKEKAQDISEETLELIKIRDYLVKQNEFEDVKFLTTMIRKSRRKDKHNAILDTISAELDIKDRWF